LLELFFKIFNKSQKSGLYSCLCYTKGHYRKDNRWHAQKSEPTGQSESKERCWASYKTPCCDYGSRMKAKHYADLKSAKKLQQSIEALLAYYPQNRQ